MNIKSFIALLILVLLVLSGCVRYENVPSKANESGWSEEGVREIVSSINTFAIDIYSKLKDKEENIFFSPYGIYSAFIMLYEGAKGNTSEELKTAFHFPEKPDLRRANFARIYNLINNNSKYFDLHTANALWIQENYPILKNYLDIIKTYYGGNAFNVDFRTDPEVARELINQWIEHQTNHTIKNFFPPNSIDSLTTLIITNAIYFKGIWLKQFNESDTREDDFWVDNDTRVKVKMMRIYDFFNYTETENVQILELPYKGNRISMLILLPKREIENLEKNLTIENIHKWMENLTETRIEVYLPRFNLSTEYSLKEPLERLGVNCIFYPGLADLSGIDGTRNLYVDRAIHKAYIKVDETGTEASAVTGIVLPISLPITFKANHPFIFLILDKETDVILFMGRLSNPT